MGWARLDDRWHDHPKVAAAGLEAAGLWVMCLTWAHGARRTSPIPGVVPDAVLARFAGSKAKANRLAVKLFSVGLFDQDTADGWPIHDFDRYLPKYDSDHAREAGAAGGRARAAKQTASKPLANRQAEAKQTASRDNARDARKNGNERVTSKNVPSFVAMGFSDDLHTPNTLRPAQHPSSEAVQAKQTAKQTASRADARASARRNPVPVPSEGANAPSAPNAADTTPPAAPDGAQALIAEWIDHCDGGRPPGRVIGQVSREIGQMLAEGIPPSDVRNGLAAWHGRGLHPSTLASVVHEVRTASQRTPRGPNANSAENRFAKAAQIAAELRAERDQPPQLATVLDLPAIGSIP